MKRNTKGAILVILPPVLLMLAVPGYAIASFIISSLIGSGVEAGGSAVIVGNLINILLGLMGVIGILGMFTLCPVGLYLLFTKGKQKSTKTPDQGTDTVQ